MSYVQSLYKLTFSPAASPLVVLNYGQWIDAELAWRLQKGCEVISPVDSRDGFIRDALQSTYSLTVKTYTTESLDLTARVNAMQALVAVSALGKKPLRVEIQGHGGGHYWQFASSFITAHAPVRVVQSAVARWERQWDIVATELAYV